MKNKSSTKGTVSVSALLLSFSVTASNLSTQFDFVPYVGVDLQYRNMPFKKNYGGNIFKKTLPQAKFFVGNRFNEYFGFELGYNTSKKMKQNVKLVPGQRVAGGIPIPTQPTNAFLNIHSTSKISGFSANFLTFLPLQTIEGFDLVGSSGVTRTKSKLFYNTLNNTGRPFRTGTVLTRTFSAHKVLMCLGGGVQYTVLNNLSIILSQKNRQNPGSVVKIRLFIVWECSLRSKFKASPSPFA